MYYKRGIELGNIMRVIFFITLVMLLFSGCPLRNNETSSLKETSPTTNAEKSSEDFKLTPCKFPEDYPVRVLSAEVDPIYKDMLIPREKGWLGSDDAHSIPLSNKKILWLFGDTPIGVIKDGKRVLDNPYDFINNCIAIQDLTVSPSNNVEFFWKSNEGKPSSFFPHQEGTAGNYYWPTMGTILNNELFIFCYPVEPPINIPDTVLIRIPNPQEPPLQWIQKAYDLKLGNVHQGFHSAIFIEKPYLYCLGYDDPNGVVSERRTVLARVKIADLLAGRLGDAYEFWVDGDKGPQWGSEPKNLVTLFEPGVTETGIQYIKEWGLFICITYQAEEPHIYITTATSLTGPWSKPVCIYHITEHNLPFNIMSYAVRPHPELSTKPGELILTYATSPVWEDLDKMYDKEGLSLYYPRFLRVQLELGPK